MSQLQCFKIGFLNLAHQKYRGILGCQFSQQNFKIRHANCGAWEFVL